MPIPCSKRHDGSCLPLQPTWPCFLLFAILTLLSSQATGPGRVPAQPKINWATWAFSGLSQKYDLGQVDSLSFGTLRQGLWKEFNSYRWELQLKVQKVARGMGSPLLVRAEIWGSSKQPTLVAWKAAAWGSWVIDGGAWGKEPAAHPRPLETPSLQYQPLWGPGLVRCHFLNYLGQIADFYASIFSIVKWR